MKHKLKDVLRKPKLIFFLTPICSLMKQTSLVPLAKKNEQLIWKQEFSTIIISYRTEKKNKNN